MSERVREAEATGYESSTMTMKQRGHIQEHFTLEEADSEDEAGRTTTSERWTPPQAAVCAGRNGHRTRMDTHAFTRLVPLNPRIRLYFPATDRAVSVLPCVRDLTFPGTLGVAGEGRIASQVRG